MQKEEKKIPVLFDSKEKCCGCGACMNICPMNAITMQEDECGYIYPIIDEQKCIRCGRCKSVCAFQNEQVTNVPLVTYAAVARDKELVRKSASGGIFAALAHQIIDEGGAVFGAAFIEDWNVQHIMVETKEDIYKLQGSKYTQSNTANTYALVKDILKQGKKVLYSGTPCQIAGLYGYLGNKPDGLYTVDLVCHGVPNNRMFREYIQNLEEHENAKVDTFVFRDKANGWGINGTVVFVKNGRMYKKKAWQSASTYLFYFTKGWIYRENCYQCKYACAHRPGDFSIGDFWGIEKQHPEYLSGSNKWDEQKGISCMVVNTDHGSRFLQMVDGIEKRDSSFEAVSSGNAQLKRPCNKGKRDEILELYRNNGWKGLEERYNKNIGWRKYSSQIKAILPAQLKKLIKQRGR